MTTKEQLEELLKDIPKTYNMVSAYSSINVKDLEEAVDRFKYVPNYQDLLEENNKQQKEIERLNNIINRMEKDLEEMYITFGEFSEEYTEKKIRELKEGK